MKVGHLFRMSDVLYVESHARKLEWLGDSLSDVWEHTKRNCNTI